MNVIINSYLLWLAQQRFFELLLMQTLLRFQNQFFTEVLCRASQSFVAYFTDSFLALISLNFNFTFGVTSEEDR